MSADTSAACSKTGQMTALRWIHELSSVVSESIIVELEMTASTLIGNVTRNLRLDFCTRLTIQSTDITAFCCGL